MFEMVPWRKNNKMIERKGDVFEDFLNNFFDEDFAAPMELFRNDFRVDLKENEKEYIVEADLPGVNKEAINIEYNNGYLAISAKRENVIEDKSENYVRRERNYGEFKRVFYVDNIDENRIDAKFDNGVLNIILPKLNEGKKSKRIIIN